MAEVETRSISHIRFGLVSPNAIRDEAVVEVVSEETFSGGKPVEGGLFDLRMGPITPNDRCMTCKQNTRWCPGHFGYLELSAPIFHPEYLDVIKKVLETICFNCGSLLLSQEEAGIARALRVNRRLLKIRELIKGRRVCPRCKLVQPNITNHRGQFKLTYRFSGETAEEERVITPALCREILKRINPSDAEAIGFSRNNRPEWMVLEVIPVSPPAVRPSVVTDSNQRGEDDITAHLASIIRYNRMLRSKLEQKNLPEAQIVSFAGILNFNVNAMMAGTARRGSNVLGARFITRSGKPLKSIHDRISGKSGRVRRNLMGKRVDYSARSVISPDPNLDLDELGMPLEVAKILTYPEIVNDYTRERLYRYISNNKTNTYPMALNIQRGNQIRTLKHMNLEEIILETGDVVVRQIIDGDIVLFNRQPTLHRMSMMAFKVKVMPVGKTFRINLSVTTPFNADFDGDEMNAHIPQSLTTANEIWELARVSTQIVTPQSNGPIIGIVQDGLLGSYLFTRHNTRITEQFAMNLLGVVRDFTGNVPQPLEVKGKEKLYNGRQIISQILPAINLQRFNSSYSEKVSNPDPAYISNGKVIIRNGVLESGILDKGTLGAKKEGSIAHVIYNDFGADQAKEFLSNLQKIINKYLLYRGFSVSIGDVIPDPELRLRMNQKIVDSLEEIHELNRRVQEGRYLAPIGFSVEQHLEAQSIEKLNGVTLSVASQALKVLNPETNGLMAMVSSGSKGSDINIGQITGAVGQQIVNQKRVPPVYGNHRTLPIYHQYDLNPVSRGFVEHSFVQGLTQPEFLFHMASGREGIIDTAIRTADSGYISRKLVKALEDLMVNNNFTVRNANGHIIQFRYGEDGINPVYIEKQKLISFEMDNKQLEEVYRFREAEVKESTTPIVFREIFSPSKAEETKKLLREEFEQIRQDRDFIRSKILTRLGSGGEDTTYQPVNIRRLIINIQNALSEKEKNKVSDLNPVDVILRLRNLLDKLPYFFGNRLRTDWKPLDNDYNASHLFRILMRSHLSSKQVIKQYKLSSIAFENLLTSIEAKYFASISPPAEMVGIIGAQSLGEPSTQLTLNTFHYSGVASKSNITTGVPRLKELIDVSKTQKSPYDIIYLKDDAKFSKAKAETLRNEIRNTFLIEFVDKVQIFYDPKPIQQSIIKEDRKFIDDFFKYSVGRKAPLLTPWTIRFELNRYKMFLNQMTMELIRRRLARESSELYPIITDENAKEAILRVQLLATTKYSMEDVIKLKDKILDEISLRGIQGIEGSQVREGKIKLINPETGALETKTEYYVDTDGTNLREVLKHPLVDISRTRSTNIIEVFEVLGIEAARSVLLEEIRQVMSDSYINYHNYAILIDTMTQMGVLTPNSRHGFNRLDKSPISKTTFEETTEQLKSASLYAEEDNMRSVSARVIFGETIKGGTGLSEIMINEDAFGIGEEDIEKIMGI